MTYQAIADAVGVSVQTVHNVAHDVQLSNFGKLPGADGKHYPPAYAPRREPEEQPEPLPDVELIQLDKLPGKDGKARRKPQDAHNGKTDTPH